MVVEIKIYERKYYDRNDGRKKELTAVDFDMGNTICGVYTPCHSEEEIKEEVERAKKIIKENGENYVVNDLRGRKETKQEELIK